MPSPRLTPVAALCAAALLSGCGASVSNSSTSPTTSTSTTPGPNQFNPQLVPPQAKTTTTTTTTRSKLKVKPKAKSTGKKSKPSNSSSNTGGSAPTSGGSSGGGGTRTVTVTQRVTVTRTRTIVRNPSVPYGAHVPSTLPALAYTHFTVPGGNIGCRLGGGAVRCDIGSRVWRAPNEPGDCNLAWGQGLEVGPSGAAHFVCAGDSVLDPTGPLVPAGRDDRVGSVTCQVRSFGVTCFDGGGSGFFISRTGYDTF